MWGSTRLRRHALILKWGAKDEGHQMYHTFREWEMMNGKQKSYLIHLRPPGDTITQVVRNLVKNQNITNAAILFDDQFGMKIR